jgi:hypothetical protein
LCQKRRLGRVGACPAANVGWVTPRPPSARRSARTPDRSQACVQTDTQGEAQCTHAVEVLGVRAEVHVSGTWEARIAAIAEKQRGRVSRRQLRAAGLSRGVIDRLVGRQLLFPVQRGVFAVGHPGPVELGDATAALLAAGPGAVLSHHTAAVLWGIRPTDSGDGQIHVTVPEASSTPGRMASACTARAASPTETFKSASAYRSPHRPAPSLTWRRS